MDIGYDVTAIKGVAGYAEAMRRSLLCSSSLLVFSFRIQRGKILTPTLGPEIALICWLGSYSLSCVYGTSFYIHRRAVEFSRIFCTILEHWENKKFMVISSFLFFFFFFLFSYMRVTSYLLTVMGSFCLTDKTGHNVIWPWYIPPIPSLLSDGVNKQRNSICMQLEHIRTRKKKFLIKFFP